MDLNNLRAEFRSIMNDPFPGQGDNRFSTDEIDDWLNDAQLAVNAEFRLLWNSATLSTDGTALVDLNTLLSDFQAPLHVYYNGREIPYVEMEALSRLSYRWHLETGAPQRYTLRGQHLVLHPYTSAAADILTLHYLEMPDVMTMINNEPLGGVARFRPLHRLVLYEACMTGAIKVGEVKLLGMLEAAYGKHSDRIEWIVKRPDQGHESMIANQDGYPY